MAEETTKKAAPEKLPATSIREALATPDSNAARKVANPAGTVVTPASADVANKAAVKTNKSAQLGSTGVDTAEVMVFAMGLTAAAGATMTLRRRGQGRYDVMARHAR